jgi:hypothetical protein
MEQPSIPGCAETVHVAANQLDQFWRYRHGPGGLLRTVLEMPFVARCPGVCPFRSGV